MTISKELLDRCEGKCELCNSEDGLDAYVVSPRDDEIVICNSCNAQLNGDGSDIDVNHWRCLNESMWSEVDGVKVIAWRMLDRLKAEVWAQGLLDMIYLEDDVMAWAQAGSDSGDDMKYIDCNGALLKAGDTIVVIKDLDVKGTSFTAKRGTAVRNISLDPNNAEQIEGRVNGQQIVIYTKFVKKSK